MSEKNQITREEWFRQGKELFGESMMDWEFVCPSCKHVQKPQDFKPFEKKGATPDSATKECIGRYRNTERVDMCSGKSPCNYAAYGFLNICTTTVVDEDGAKIPVFSFNLNTNPATQAFRDIAESFDKKKAEESLEKERAKKCR